LRRVALVRTNVSEDVISSVIGVKRIGELGTTLAITSKRSAEIRSVLQLVVTVNVVASSPIVFTLMEVICSSETSSIT
jgi:hypothetical protein